MLSKPHAQVQARAIGVGETESNFVLCAALIATALLAGLFGNVARAQTSAYQQTNIVSDGQ